MLGLARLAQSHRGSIPSVASGRYWKLNILATQANDGYVNCCLIALNSIVGARVNQCVGIGTSTESSVYSSQYSSINAWNNSDESGATTNPFWHSAAQSAPWWTIFDCGVGKSISAGEIALQGCNVVTRMPTHFQLYTSNDNATWSLVLDTSNIAGWVAGTPKFFMIP